MSTPATVLAPTGTRLLAVLLWAVAGCGLGWLFLVNPGEGAAVMPFVLAFCLAVYAVAWRPCVRLGPDSVELRNVLRNVEISFALVEEISTRYGLHVHAGGRRYLAWGAPAPGWISGRPVPGRRSQQRALREVPGLGSPSSSLGSVSGAHALLVRQAWERWQTGPAKPDAVEQVRVRWVWWIPALTALVLAWCVLSVR